MKFKIFPYLGAGEIRFGMSYEEVRAILGEEFESFKRSPETVFPSDYYMKHGVFIYYTSAGKVEAIEFSSQANVTLEGNSLFDKSYAELESFFLLKDQEMEIEYDDFTSYKLGVGAYAPNKNEDQDLAVESIIVFEKGYYDF